MSSDKPATKTTMAQSLPSSGSAVSSQGSEETIASDSQLGLFGRIRNRTKSFLRRRIPLRIGKKGFSITCRTLLAFITSIVILAVALLFFITPIFGVRTIKVTGLREITATQIQQTAAIAQGKPLASLDISAIGRRIKSIAAVDKVSVSRQWPTTVLIRIVERSAIAVAVMPSGAFQLVDKYGVPFRTVMERPAGLPLIEVPRLVRRDPVTLAAALVAQALTPTLRERLIKIFAYKADRVSLQLTDGKTIYWGEPWDPGDNARKATAASALIDRKGSYIDVSAPSIVTVR